MVLKTWFQKHLLSILLHLISVSLWGLTLTCWVSRGRYVFSHLQVCLNCLWLVLDLLPWELGSSAIIFHFLHSMPREAAASSELLSLFSGGIESWNVSSWLGQISLLFLQKQWWAVLQVLAPKWVVSKRLQFCSFQREGLLLACKKYPLSTYLWKSLIISGWNIL